MNMKFLVIFLVLAVSQAANITGKLAFHNGKFKILQFTDLHYDAELEDFRTEANQKQLIEKEKPDLVVLTGDSVSGSSIAKTAAGIKHFKNKWKQLVAPMIKYQVPWAMVIGNHDPDGPLSRADIMALDTSFTGSLAKTEKVSNQGGLSNYRLQIYESDSSTALIATILWFFDITTYGCEGAAGDDCIATDLVQWYQDETIKMRQQRNGKALPAFMFSHVPLPEYMDLWNNESCLGVKGESVCCPTKNTGFYRAMVDLEEAKAMFVGHDHVDDYCGAFKEHPNLTLCYGRKTGWGYYNPDRHGGRVIELSLDSATSDVSWKTWIRDDLGNIVNQEWHQPTGPGQQKCGASGKRLKEIPDYLY